MSTSARRSIFEGYPALWTFVGCVLTLLVTVHLEKAKLANETGRELGKERREAAVAFLAAVDRGTSTAREGIEMIWTASVADGKAYLARLQAEMQAQQSATARLTLVATSREEVAMCRLLNASAAYMEALTAAGIRREDEAAMDEVRKASATFEAAKAAFPYAVRG